jgi:hypothetical protein
MEYGQSYYTLRSILLDGVPPPAVHMHIRVFNVAQEVPIGNLGALDPDRLPMHDPAAEVNIPEEEAAKFDEWLRALWQDKDRLLTRFHETGSFLVDSDSEKAAVCLPLRLQGS